MMKTLEYDVVVVGGGPAGMAAACACYDEGAGRIVILERDCRLGGILQQCIHNGFGLRRYREELTGPEYAERDIAAVAARGIAVMLQCMALEVTPQKEVYCISPDTGVCVIRAKAVILAMGCRERTRGNIRIPGTRPPKGIYTAGLAQKMVNMMGVLPGKEVVVLGSGDIGLIMARRMLWEGAQVKMVCELLPYSAGLARNIQQCLRDYEIPLKLRTTVVDIHGTDYLTGVTIASVDEKGVPIQGTETVVSCDTLLLSVGLIPENELSRSAGILLDSATGGPMVSAGRETSVPGIYACGNVLHVHDIVDYVSEESVEAGKAAARTVREAINTHPVHLSEAHGKESLKTLLTKEKNMNFENLPQGKFIMVNVGEGVRYVVPQRIARVEELILYCRVIRPLQTCRICLKADGAVIAALNLVRAVPSEMIRLRISAEQAEQVLKARSIVIEAAEIRQEEKGDDGHNGHE